MFLRVYKYPINVIFRNANINAQHANVTNRLNELAQYTTAASYVYTYIRTLKTDNSSCNSTQLSTSTTDRNIIYIYIGIILTALEKSSFLGLPAPTYNNVSYIFCSHEKSRVGT